MRRLDRERVGVTGGRMCFQGRAAVLAILAVVVHHDQPSAVGVIVGAAGGDADVVVAVRPPLPDLLFIGRGALRPALDCWRLLLGNKWKNAEAVRGQRERSFPSGEHFAVVNWSRRAW